MVAVGAARHCSETLEMASALAARVGADLEVVFVEDEDLLRIADLPVTREIDRLSATTREIDSGRMLQALQGEARRLRREVARIGKTSSVRSTVRIVRGQILSEALNASARTEVTFIHGVVHAPPGEHSPRRAAKSRGSPSLVRLASATPGRKPVWTLFEGGAAGVRTLQVAAKLTRALECRLTVLLPYQRSEQAERLEHEARTVVDQAELRFFEVAGNRAILHEGILAPGASRLLVLAKQSPALEDAAVRRYLESLPVPLVLVR